MRHRQQAPRGCQDRLLAGSLQGLYGPLRGRRRVGIPETYVLPRHRRRGIDRQHDRLYLAQVLLLDDLGRKPCNDNVALESRCPALRSDLGDPMRKIALIVTSLRPKIVRNRTTWTRA